jgi:hypothetical protein
MEFRPHTRPQQLLRGGDDARELMDGGSELFLQVADTVAASAGTLRRLGRRTRARRLLVGCERDADRDVDVVVLMRR